MVSRCIFVFFSSLPIFLLLQMEPLLSHGHQGSSKGPAGRIGLYLWVLFFCSLLIPSGIAAFLFILFFIHDQNHAVHLSTSLC